MIFILFYCKLLRDEKRNINAMYLPNIKYLHSTVIEISRIKILFFYPVNINLLSRGEGEGHH